MLRHPQRKHVECVPSKREIQDPKWIGDQGDRLFIGKKSQDSITLCSTKLRGQRMNHGSFHIKQAHYLVHGEAPGLLFMPVEDQSRLHAPTLRFDL